jgi:hypothetical protein
MSRQSTKRTDATVVMPILIPVLGEELAAAVIEHRDTLREPLTEYAAKLQVKEYIATGNPVAAAEMQILRGWRAIKNSWFQNEVRKDQRQFSQSTRRTIADAARSYDAQFGNSDASVWVPVLGRH